LVYEPQPIDTSDVQLKKELQLSDEEVFKLIERLAKNAHDVWARQRMSDGTRKEHPNLVPYDELPEKEKVYDRSVVMETLRAIVVLGYQIEKAR